MENDFPNATSQLVHAILELTATQRRSPSLQSICQYIYCQFSINDHENLTDACEVKTTKLSLYDNGQRIENPYIFYIVQCIQLYIYPIFIFTGILGNGLSGFIMFQNVRRSGYSANLYLTLLALADSLFLLGSAIPEWISQINSDLNIKYVSDLCCRLVYWFGHFTTHLSAGLVVSVTVERFIAVRYPLLAPKINTVSHTHIVLIGLIVFLFVLDSRVFILVRQFNEVTHVVSTCPNDTDIGYVRAQLFRCDIVGEKNEQLWALVDFAAYTLIPFLIIITLNSLIIHRLIHAERFRQKMSCRNAKSSEHIRTYVSDDQQMVTSGAQPLRRSRSFPAKRPSSTSPRGQAHQNSFRVAAKLSDLSTESSLMPRSRSQRSSENSSCRQPLASTNIRLTILLLAVSFSFLALTSPAVVFNLTILSTYQPRSSQSRNYANVTSYNLDSYTRLYHTIIRLFMIMNHSINFVLYFVVGKRFRRDLKRICCAC